MELVIEDPGLADEVGLAVAVTGRRLLVAEVTEGTGSDRSDRLSPERIVVTDSAGGDGSDGSDSGAGAGPADGVYEIRVSAHQRQDALQIPEQSAELAAMIGCADPVDISVHGIVGGAGASVFAAALAGTVAEMTDGEAVLVDADRDAWSGHHHLLLGLEGREHGGRPESGDSGDSGDSGEKRDTPQRWRAAQVWADDVAVVGSPAWAAGTGGCPLRDGVVGGLGLSIVRDHGRVSSSPPALTPASAQGAGAQAAGTWHGRYRRHRVIVVPQTVPGVLAARRECAADPETWVVLRELPRSGLTWNQTLSLLGRQPDVTWQDDPFLMVDIDRGDFRTTGQAAGTAGGAARALWEVMVR